MHVKIDFQFKGAENASFQRQSPEALEHDQSNFVWWFTNLSSACLYVQVKLVKIIHFDLLQTIELEIVPSSEMLIAFPRTASEIHHQDSANE